MRPKAKDLLVQPSRHSSKRFRFGTFVLDLGRGILQQGEESVKLRPQSFEVLRILIENHGRLVRKSQLIESVWPGVIVTDGSLTQCVADIRRAIGDRQRTLIQTVPRRGYVFSEPVHNQDPPPDRRSPRRLAPSRLALVAIAIVATFVAIAGMHAQRATPAEKTQASLANIAIAVFPFTDRGTEDKDNYIRDGVYDDILTNLAGIEQLIVVPRTSVEAHTNTMSVVEARKHLGVGAILKGAIQRAENRVRIHVQLIDTDSNHHLWAASFDQDQAIDHPFDARDEIATAIALAVETRLFPERHARVASLPATDRSRAGDYEMRR